MLCSYRYLHVRNSYSSDEAETLHADWLKSRFLTLLTFDDVFALKIQSDRLLTHTRGKSRHSSVQRYLTQLDQTNPLRRKEASK